MTLAIKPTLSAVSGNLGSSIFSENNQISVKYTEANIPFTTTTGNTMINWKGKVRLLTIQGAQDGTGYTGANGNEQINDFIQEMEAWVNTNIVGARVYTDSFGNTYDVKPVDFTWTRSFSDSQRIIFSLIMKEV